MWKAPEQGQRGRRSGARGGCWAAGGGRGGVEKWSDPGCVLELGLARHAMGLGTGEGAWGRSKGDLTCPPAGGSVQLQTKVRTVLTFILPSTHQGFAWGLNYVVFLAPCTHNVSSRPSLTCLQRVLGRHMVKFSLLSPGALAQKGRCVAADGLWQVPEESSGHLGSLCHDLQAGMAFPVWSQALPREAATSHACSYSSHRAGPGSTLLLCLPLQLKESHLSETEIQAISQAMIQEQWVGEKEKADHPCRGKIIP